MKRIFPVILALFLLFIAVCDSNAPGSPESQGPAEPNHSDTPPAEPIIEPQPAPVLTMHVLSTGHSDCIYLECDGQTLLIDSGTYDKGTDIVNYLKRQGVEDLDYVISTHSHSDHTGGFPAVFEAFPVGKVYGVMDDTASGRYKKFLRSMKKQNLTFTEPKPGDHFLLGDAVISFLGPVNSYTRVNDNSIVVKVLYGSRSFLLAADMEANAENDMLDYWGDRINWNVDVLKAGHHALNTSTSERFTRAVCPEHAIATTYQRYTSDEEVKHRLLKAGATYYCTDLLGPIVVTTDGDSLDIVWSNRREIPEFQKPTATLKYLGDRTAKVFHMERCDVLPADRKLKKFKTYEAALRYGLTPCSECLRSFG